MKHGGLGRTAAAAVRRHGVHSVLENIKIETAHIHDAKLMQLLINKMKLELLIGFKHFFLQVVCPLQRPLIQRQHIFYRHGIRRIETPQSIETVDFLKREVSAL